MPCLGSYICSQLIALHVFCISARSYQLLDGLLQLLHVHIVALPLLEILPLLGLERPRATSDARCDHGGAISSLRLASVLMSTGASRENFLVENFRPRWVRALRRGDSRIHAPSHRELLFSLSLSNTTGLGLVRRAEFALFTFRPPIDYTPHHLQPTPNNASTTHHGGR